MNIEEAVAAVAAGRLTEHEAVMAVSPMAVEAALHAQFDVFNKDGAANDILHECHLSNYRNPVWLAL